jgi:hypothetical protein
MTFGHGFVDTFAGDPDCVVCGGRPHTSAERGHRYTVACSWPLGCPAVAHRGLEYEDVFGRRQRYYYCEPHLRDIVSGDAYRRTVDQAHRLGLNPDITRPPVITAKAELDAHQAGCQHCDGVRKFINAEMAAGRVQTLDDRDRMGRYTIEHACAVGLPLFEALGRAMMT